MAALSQTPGLHLALGLASAAASYINLGLLWHWLRKAGVYDRQPGWARYLLRLGTACAAMAVALLVALHWVPDFTVIGTREGQVPRNALIKDRTQSKDVTAFIYRTTHGLLWRKILRRAHNHAFACPCEQLGTSVVFD